MRHNQFTTGTIAACFAERDRSPPLNVDKKRELPQMRRLLTLWTLAQAQFCVRVEHERIARMQSADSSLRHRCILPARTKAI
jgi:hypothetical protein